MALSQQNQPVSVSTSLGADALVFWGMSYSEELSNLYEFDLRMLSEDAGIKPQDVIGITVQVTQKHSNGSKRYFHGYVTQFGAQGSEGRYFRYRATVQPWLWFLTRTSDCRIFQSMTVPDIIKKVVGDLGFSAYLKVSLSATYPTLNYCVQYRETAFDFICRLMEREGIYYFFTHEDGKHMMVLADGISSHDSVPGQDSIQFFPGAAEGAGIADHISKWSHEQQVEPTTYTLNDFDFEHPSASLISKSKVARSHAQSTFEMYDYPGGYVVTSDGDTYAADRIQEWQAQYDIAQAITNVFGVSAGFLFTLTDHPTSDQNQKYLITSAACQFDGPDYESGGSAPARDPWKITAIPSSQQYRPLRRTPRTTVRGPQTAIVVGPSGEEIYTDKYGRIKVQFHWDRLGTKDENSSCWIRVSQTWAGKTWGAIHIPRIGQEVIVDFLEGDPDQPIVTGCVYNADQMPPYTLPDNMTQSGIKSRSTKDGVAENFNELRFEDKKDSEEIYFHAEKNFTRVVENNDSIQIGYTKKDKGDQTIEIFNNQKLVVGGGGTDAADGSQTIEIQKDRTATLKTGNEKLEVQKGNRDVIVTEGNDTHTISKGNRTVTIDQGNDALTITQGNQTITISAGKSTIEAGTSIELKVGGSSIKIEPSKITLTSVEIDIQANAKIAAQGAMIQVSADATLALKGGMVQIN